MSLLEIVFEMLKGQVIFATYLPTYIVCAKCFLLSGEFTRVLLVNTAVTEALNVFMKFSAVNNNAAAEGSKFDGNNAEAPDYGMLSSNDH
jgi:hypothetical protein